MKDRQIKFDSFLGKKLDSIDFKGQQKILKDLKEINNFTIQNLNENNIDEANKNLNKLNDLLKNQIQNIESVDRNDLTVNLKELISDITSSQEKYATSYGKNQTIRGDSIKRKERIKNIDQELENWKDLKLNSEKMILELSDKNKKRRI